MSMIAIHIIRTSRETKHAMYSSQQLYWSNKPRSTAELLNKALSALIWFPLTPILSQWFNVTLIAVRYYTQQIHTWMDFVNIALLGLQSIILVIALFVNPSALSVIREWRRQRRRQTTSAAAWTKHEPISAYVLEENSDDSKTDSLPPTLLPIPASSSS
ncbi:hypothetical protein GQ54DRAFT_313578 [Martensiomyces pterosporus]|nr:hypothetical protein GQ54DRAFT_313578 [Martensiomyces pterosporus]